MNNERVPRPGGPQGPQDGVSKARPRDIVDREATSGRRIYVHQDSFIDLASRSRESAHFIFSSLALTNATKIAHHHLGDAVDLGILSEGASRGIMRALEAGSTDRLTDMMHRIGYRSPERYNDFFPLLGEDERIVSSCSESGYFTYATGEGASERMFAEKGSLRQERSDIRSGTGPDDVTMIKGRVLALLDPNLPTGPDTARSYFPKGNGSATVDVSELDEIKGDVRTRVLSDLASTIRSAYPWDADNEEHARILQDLFASVTIGLTKGIFAESSPAAKPNGRRNVV